jgi:hypothetical protein
MATFPIGRVTTASRPQGPGSAKNDRGHGQPSRHIEPMLLISSLMIIGDVDLQRFSSYLDYV